MLPSESASQDTVLYVAPADLPDFQKTYRARVEQFSKDCQETCPRELQQTLGRLAALELPAFQPLLSPRTAGALSRPPTPASPAPTPLPLAALKFPLPSPGLSRRSSAASWRRRCPRRGCRPVR
ncbi:hypothetical protein ACFP9V_04480 [Deinococcus radiopugnans]|uniref:hypothetical protein n=1 Tax=Deinococcus radiopugnans TaxID=57497 RepID=UPI003622E203